MREIVLSNCERNFVNKAIGEYTRLDGRSLLEARPVKIYFGSNWGSCVLSLGNTRASARVTCDIQQPRVSRPNEGMIHVNVELGPLAAQHFETGRQSEMGTLINSLVEKCLMDTNCIDLESLCIVVNKKVWNIRVDINILNHDGNLVDCASIAALTALLHFHRPDVTSTGEEIIIHPFIERDPLPLTLFHHPVCVSFITFECGNTVMDPTYIEERIGVAELTIGINAYKELCTLHFDYLTKTLTIEDVISSVMERAASYAKELINQIRTATTNDIQARYNKDNTRTSRFKDCIATEKLTFTTMITSETIPIKLKKWNAVPKTEDDNMEVDDDKNSCIIKSGEGSAVLLMNKDEMVGEGGRSTWHEESSSFESETSDVEVIIEPTENKDKKNIESIVLGDESEEELTETVSGTDLMR